MNVDFEKGNNWFSDKTYISISVIVNLKKTDYVAVCNCIVTGWIALQSSGESENDSNLQL